MSFTYDPFFYLAKPSDGDNDHGDELRRNFEVLAAAQCPDNSFFVSAGFATGDLHHASATTPRHFSTIQGAIDEIATLGASSAYTNYTIFLWPGDYSENLTISESVTIQGMGFQNNLGQGGARGPRIRGTAGSASSTITITPQAGASLSVNLNNVGLDNLYSASNSTVITNPYLIDLQDTGTSSTITWLGMGGCDCRMQTLGSNNLWTYGIKTRGHVYTSIRNSVLYAGDWANGTSDGGIQYLFDIAGRYAGSEYGRLFMDSSSVYHLYNGYAREGFGRTFFLDYNTTGRVTRTCLAQGAEVMSYYQGSNGSNGLPGVTTGNLATYGNLPIIGVEI